MHTFVNTSHSQTYADAYSNIQLCCRFDVFLSAEPKVSITIDPSTKSQSDFSTGFWTVEDKFCDEQKLVIFT